jgi:magnesium transporter
LSIDPNAPKPVIRVLAYGPDGFEEKEIHRPAKLTAFLQKWPVTWVNVTGLGDATVIEKIGEVFGLHRLALEDVVHVDQRPKVDEYEGHVFVVSRMPGQDRAGTEQVSLFAGKGFVLTFQEREGDCFEGVRDRIRAGRKRLAESGPDYLTYALLDSLIDSYFPVVEKLGERLEQTEGDVVERPSATTVAEIQQVKSVLVSLRRAISPHRDVINGLLRGQSGFFEESVHIYLRDCNDHVLQIVDLVESYREICSDLVNLYLSSVSNRMNEVMKVLTVIATIFIPLSFIAGLYGMNFDPGVSPFNMPELSWYWGYPFALGLMLLVGIGFVVYLRFKKWI